MKRLLFISLGLTLSLLVLPTLLLPRNVEAASPTSAAQNSGTVGGVGRTVSDLQATPNAPHSPLPVGSSALPTNTPPPESPSALPTADAAAPLLDTATPTTTLMAPETVTPSPDDAAAVTEQTAPDDEVTIRLITSSGVKTMTLADYLPGAVTAEMPPSFPQEALKAQAVAVRTLAHNRIAGGQAGRGKHSNGDLCTSAACCLAYKAAANECARAVADTDGIIMLSDGEPILAVFHSSSGGKTRDSKAVWGGHLSYLVAVESPDADIGKSGHGVGMSQYGARSMANDGSAYYDILRHYYSGVELTTAG